MKKYIKILDALNASNLVKDTPQFQMFKEQFLYNKNLIINYLISKSIHTEYRKAVYIDTRWKYIKWVVDEVGFWNYMFHFNLRTTSKRITTKASLSHKNPNRNMPIIYALTYIEQFKNRHWLI